MGSLDSRQIFENFLARRREGEDVPIEELFAAHPDQAQALRELWVEHRQGEAAIEEALPASEPEKSISFFGRQEQETREQSPEVAKGQVLGDFRLLRPIGEGGMGQVWEAEQVSLRRRVALKVLRPDRITLKTLDLFAREARAGGRLNHPGLVAVHGHDETEGIAWIAMEFVDGSWTLRDFLDEVTKRDELPVAYYRDVAEFVAKLADALHAAHTAGVIHRDLKPQNVLVTPEDEPKVTDFGLARITDESALSVTGDFAGTYVYMSPEQVAAKRIGLDHRTDVFSLGVVLYEMLALRRPFEGDTAAQVGQQIVTKDPPDLQTLRSQIPRDLAVIAGKCLEKDRDRRYASMSEVADDLRRYLARAPISARAPGRARKIQLWALRNPEKATALAALAAVAGLLALGLLRETGHSNRLRSLASELASSVTKERGARLAAEASEARALQSAYSSAIRAAQTAVRSGTLSEARDHLDSCPSRLQGWEWGVLDLTISTYSEIGPETAGGGRLLRIREDGLAAASINRHGVVEYDRSNGALLRRHELATSEEFLDARYTEGGQLLVLARTNDILQVTSGAERIATIPVDTQEEVDWQLSTCCEWVISFDSSTIILRPLDDGRSEARIVTDYDPQQELYLVFTTRDGQLIASRDYEGLVEIWDIGTSERRSYPICSPRSLDGIYFHQPSSRLISALSSSGSRLSIWEVQKENLEPRGEVALPFSLLGEGAIIDVSPDGESILCQGQGDRTYLVKWKESECYEVPLRQHGVLVDGQSVADMDQGRLVEWQVGLEPPPFRLANQESVASDPKPLRGSRSGEKPIGHPVALGDCAATRSGNVLCLGYRRLPNVQPRRSAPDLGVYFGWDLESGELSLYAETADIPTCLVGLGGRDRFAVGHASGVVKILDARGSEIRALEHGARVLDIAVDGSGDRYAVVTYGASVGPLCEIVDLTTGLVVSSLALNGRPRSVDMARDGSTLLVVTQRGLVAWDLSGTDPEVRADLPGDFEAGALLNPSHAATVERTAPGSSTIVLWSLGSTPPRQVWASPLDRSPLIPAGDALTFDRSGSRIFVGSRVLNAKTGDVLLNVGRQTVFRSRLPGTDTVVATSESPGPEIWFDSGLIGTELGKRYSATRSVMDELAAFFREHYLASRVSSVVQRSEDPRGTPHRRRVLDLLDSPWARWQEAVMLDTLIYPESSKATSWHRTLAQIRTRNRRAVPEVVEAAAARALGETLAATKQAPQDGGARLALAAAYLVNGRREEAMAAARLAIDLAPQGQEAYVQAEVEWLQEYAAASDSGR